MAKKSKGKKNEEEFQAAYAEEEEKVLGPKPTCYDTLPFQAYRGGKAALIALPGT